MQAARSFQHSRSAEPVKGILAALVLRTLDGTCLTPSGVSTWPLACSPCIHMYTCSKPYVYLMSTYLWGYDGPSLSGRNGEIFSAKG
jgi:hypothetical protein